MIKNTVIKKAITKLYGCPHKGQYARQLIRFARKQLECLTIKQLIEILQETSFEASRKKWGTFMKIIIIFLSLFLFITSIQAAPFLAWDPVTTGNDGILLGPGLEVTEYKVYQCTTGLGSCTSLVGTLMGTIIAPLTQFDLATTLVPAAYVITAVNAVGESDDSIPFKVKKPDLVKNKKIKK